MREANRQWLLESKDTGFMPEAMMMDIAKNTTLYEYARSGKYPLKKVMEAAERASSGDVRHLEDLMQKLHDQEPVVKYWAATGCTVLGEKAAPAKDALEKLMDDSETAVRIAAAEALYHLGSKEKAVQTLKDALQSDNLMARVQALNVLEVMEQDAIPALSAVKAMVPDAPQNYDYDTRAAKRLAEKIEENRKIKGN